MTDGFDHKNLSIPRIRQYSYEDYNDQFLPDHTNSKNRSKIEYLKPIDIIGEAKRGIKTSNMHKTIRNIKIES